MNHPSSHYPVLCSLMPLPISEIIYVNSTIAETMPALLFICKLMDSYLVLWVIIWKYHYLFCCSNCPRSGLYVTLSSLPIILCFFEHFFTLWHKMFQGHFELLCSNLRNSSFYYSPVLLILNNVKLKTRLKWIYKVILCGLVPTDTSVY